MVGTTDLKDEECGIVMLNQDEDCVKSEITSPPRGKRVDQVLTSYLFELYTTSDNKVKESIARYSKLYKLKQRNSAQEFEFSKLKEDLSNTLGSAESDIERLVENALSKTLLSLTNDIMTKDPNDPVNFEIRRQLKDFLEK